MRRYPAFGVEGRGASGAGGRDGLPVGVVDDVAGGALMTTTDVENYPGFPGGIVGSGLMDAMRKQAERFGAKLVAQDVTEVA